MKLTVKQLKQIIKEELAGVGNHPMVQMASDILSAAMSGSYAKIMSAAKKHARTLHNERIELSDPSYKGSERSEMINAFADAIYAYQTTPVKNLELLINIAKEIKFEYQTHDEREYGEDFDMDF